MKKTIVSDIDLTLLDFNISLEQFLRDDGYDIPEGFLKGENRLWNMLDITPQKADSIIHTFFETDYFTTLPPLEGSVGPVQSLYEAGWRFVAVSACPTFLGAHNRQKNLETAFGIPFEEVHLSGFDGCKRNILEMFDPTIWVEDNVRNAHIGQELGYSTYLIDQKHNRDTETTVNRVMGWDEIYKDLCTEN